MTQQRTVAVLQSSYIPWKGYFDIIHDVDLFIFYDDVQFTRQDWRSRNRIKTANGLHWLSVPAGTGIDRLIHEVRLNDPSWQAKHWSTLRQAYSKAPHFARYADVIGELYRKRAWTSLSEFNQEMTIRVASELLGISTTFADSRSFGATGQKQERLLDLLARAGATRYVSGPSARAYIDEQAFKAAGIELIYKNYSGYPEYAQLHGPFVHEVSVLDLLFTMGPESPEYIWGWRDHAS